MWPLAWIWLWHHITSPSLCNWMLQSQSELPNPEFINLMSRLCNPMLSVTGFVNYSNPKWKVYMQTTSPPMRCVLTCEFAMRKLLVNAFQKFPAELANHGFQILHCNWFRIGMLPEHSTIMNLKNTWQRALNLRWRRTGRNGSITCLLRGTGRKSGNWEKAFVPNRDAWKMARTLWKAISGQMC